MERSWFEDESHLDELLFGELDEPTQQLVGRVHQLSCGCALLRFLSERPRESMVAEDIAFHLKSSVACVRNSLEGLTALELVCRRDILGMSFWGLATSNRQHRRVQTLCTWRNHWETLLIRLGNILEGNR